MNRDESVQHGSHHSSLVDALTQSSVLSPQSFEKAPGSIKLSPRRGPTRAALPPRICGAESVDEDVSMEEKDQDDVMQRLLELGGDKKFLSFDDLNRELPDTVVSPDDIEDVLQKLEGSNITVADSDERLIEVTAVSTRTSSWPSGRACPTRRTTPSASTSARWASSRC